MAKFRARPVVIDAMQLTLTNRNEVRAWMRSLTHDGLLDIAEVNPHTKKSTDGLFIGTLEGYMEARPMDWILCGTKREFWPVKPDIFAVKYEPA